MQVLGAFYFFVLGTIVASFAGVVAARIRTGESIIGWPLYRPAGRSRCDVCGGVLKPLSLIPIVSYLVSYGRARCCGARLSPLDPLCELALGGLFAFAYLAQGSTVALPFLLAAFSVLLALVRYDLAHQVLPPPLLAVFVGTSALASYGASESFPAFASTLLTAALIAFPLAALSILSRGRLMGLSDAPLTFGLALLIGPLAFSGILYSFWIGGVVGIIVLARRPQGSRMGVEVPFAPFLAAGFILAYLTKWNILTLSAPALFLDFLK